MAQSGGATDSDTTPLLPPKILRQEVKPNAPPSAAGPAPSLDPAPGEGQSTESAAPPKKRNLANYGASNEDAARKEDDTSKSGARGMLQNPKMRLYLATGIGSLPFLLSFMLYVSSFSFYGQLIIGILCGLLAEGVYFLFTLHRKHVRKSLNVRVAQMSRLDGTSLRILLPTDEAFPKWVDFDDFEKMNWLNQAMTKFWPCINQAAGELIKAQVQPILDKYAMGFIERIVLEKVAFGTRAPQVVGVKLSAGLEDECILEIEVLWQTEKEGVVVSIDCPGPNYKVQVKNWHLHGTARIAFKPLTATIPGFGAVLVSLTEPPEFDFDLKFLGGDIGALPGIDKMIDSSIRTALMDSMVWPSRIVVPMIPGDYSFLELHPVGELDVSLIEAKGIMNTDLIGKSDPFCVMFVRQTKDKMKRSTCKKNTLNPVWNEGFKLEVEDAEFQKLTIRVMDEESVEKAEYIGACELAISDFKPGVPKEMWCEILEEPRAQSYEKSRGKLHLLVVYHAFSREEIIAKRGVTETEKKIYQEHEIQGAAEKKQNDSAGDAPKQAGNITQNPNENPRASGPAAESS